MLLYLDASALVKRHLDEKGTVQVREIFEAATVVGTSVLSRAESEAAFAKAVRTGAVTESEGRSALRDFRHDWPDFAIVSAPEPLVIRAGVLAFEHDLRGYDAVQLASALTWAEELAEMVTFATFDRQLWGAATEHSPLTPFPDDLPALLEEWA
ncbi:MAG: type II toxin-antitoxin system VapC family toxin [Salinibacter sp.]|uniref:type II toxin-antitoxin system VapC family toxin n=1 Tax=Salinibacter sp. TaxID=2065818 RepID=UPI0035D4D34B